MPTHPRGVWGFRPVILAVLAAFLGGSPLVAQYPRARVGEFEVRGFDFATNGGWRLRAGQVMAQRASLLQGRVLARLNDGGIGGLAVRGTFFIPVLPIAFKDVAPPFPSPQYQDLFFSPAPVGRPWSVKTYYTEQSRGNILLDGEVFDWVRVDSSAAYYQDGCNGIGVVAACPSRARSRMADLLIAALDSVSHGVGGDTVWNRFDNDGPDGIPNSGDDDGVVDVIAFLQPAVDGACGTAGIWSHRYRISGWNGGVPYVTRTPRRGPGGQVIPGEFLKVESYTIQSGVGGSNGCTGGQLMPIGTVAHETGHAFGLPDYYDTDPASGTQGIGEWGIMGSGNYARPYSPASFDAWSLAWLGWVRVDTLVTGATRVVPAVQTSGTVYLAATANPTIELILENRQALASDTAMMNPAYTRAKSPGLLVWQVDHARIDAGLSSNRVNTGPRQGLSLIQADGLNQLRTPGAQNRGDTGDPYPGLTGNHAFGLSTLPQAVDYDGASLDIRLDQIFTLGLGSVQFRYVRRAPSLVASREPLARIVANGVTTSVWREVIQAGDTIRVSSDSLQLAFDGRSALRFLRWSDGQARTHTITARSGPTDSLFADFDVTHRLRVTVTGPGTVSGTAAAVGAGVFLADGTPVALTATANPGAEFIGWKGDTASMAASLSLQMTGAYDLTALFVQSATIDAAAAARALLGGPALDANAAAYLDAIGNRNGSYDVGDYLAWLRRTGQHVPPALARKTGSR
jgi:M6 family metalloprotease-like protein